MQLLSVGLIGSINPTGQFENIVYLLKWIDWATWMEYLLKLCFNVLVPVKVYCLQITVCMHWLFHRLGHSCDKFELQNFKQTNRGLWWFRIIFNLRKNGFCQGNRYNHEKWHIQYILIWRVFTDADNMDWRIWKKFSCSFLNQIFFFLLRR